MWLPMYTKPKEKDPKFITKLTSERALKYWLKLMVKIVSEREIYILQ